MKCCFLKLMPLDHRINFIILCMQWIYMIKWKFRKYNDKYTIMTILFSNHLWKLDMTLKDVKEEHRNVPECGIFLGPFFLKEYQCQRVGKKGNPFRMDENKSNRCIYTYSHGYIMYRTLLQTCSCAAFAFLVITQTDR